VYGLVIFKIARVKSELDDPSYVEETLLTDAARGGQDPVLVK